MLLVEKQLGFDKIKELLKENCNTVSGQYFAEEVSWMNDFIEIQQQLLLTKEFLVILEEGHPFPFIELKNILPSLQLVKVSGSVLLGKELRDIADCLITFSKCRNFFFGKQRALFPKLSGMLTQVSVDEELLQGLQKSLDTDGDLKDDASPELKKIRNQLYDERARLRKTLDSILRNAIKNNYADDGMLPTISNGRMVIPIRAEAKRIIKGLVHDESATGATVYFEPSEVVELNNTIKELGYQENREKHRIFAWLSQLVAQHIDEVHGCYALLGELDFIKAKAKVAQQMHADLPQFAHGKVTKIIDAKNPNLILSGAQVVPLSVNFDENNRFLIVSGPNAGGKSVAIKTIGVMQYMLQSGLLVPCHRDSVFRMYDKMLVDIGDSQSIEDELSTYSAHLSFMKSALEVADAATFIILDELGSGTSPDYGGTIAEVMLETLLAKRCYGVVTTHFAQLKTYAEKNEAVLSAAMLYDVDSLTPLYKLEVGKLGHSFALELVQKTGFSKQIIQEIKDRMAPEQLELNDVVKKLEKEYMALHAHNQELKKVKDDLGKVRKEYEEVKHHLNTSKKQILDQAKKEAGKILEGANKQIEKTIYDIKKSQADKERTKQARQELEQVKQGMQVNEPVMKKVSTPVKQEKWEVGDQIVVMASGIRGEIVSIKKEKAYIRIGQIHSTVALSEIQKVGKASKNNAQKSNLGSNLMGSRLDFNTDFDMRGKRAEEAMPMLEAYIDKCLMLGVVQVRIIHGKGDGILRDLVRKLIRQFDQITRYESEHADRGGDGITVIYFE